MVHRSLKIVFAICILMASFSLAAYAQQDKVYKTDGTVLTGKVTEVTPSQIRFLEKDRPEGLVYFIKTSELDSIVYSNGTRDMMKGGTNKKKLLENIPQLNTWTFDLLGFTYLSVSQSYERRTKNGLIGFRVPFYVGFIGGGFAGEGTFLPNQGVFSNTQNGNGVSFATGLNTKFYLFNRRKVRAFAGPEATIGYGRTFVTNYDPNFNVLNSYMDHYGTVGLMGKVGLMLNPIDKFNITIDGGAGAGNMFGGQNPLGWVGLWHIGLSLGTNF
jgi:hypothetical protein